MKSKLYYIILQERNAATLLFSALIIRIFGVQRTKDHINLTTDNKMNYKLFFEKFPNLLSFILDELQKFVAMDDIFIKANVQSILLLLSRLYYNHSSEFSDNIQWRVIINYLLVIYLILEISTLHNIFYMHFRLMIL